jgi:hypothetical protein
MSKLKMLNDLKLKLENSKIEFSHVVANKMIEIKHQALANSKIEIKVSCEKDEYGAYLKVHVNDDCLGMFAENTDTEFTSVVKLTNSIKSVIKYESEYWGC